MTEEKNMSLDELVGFYRGWKQARGMDEKLSNVIEAIISQAQEMALKMMVTVEKEIPSNKPLPTHDAAGQPVTDEMVAIYYNHVNKKTVAEEKPVVEEMISTASMQKKTREAIIDDLHSIALIPPMHFKQPMCYRCTHLGTDHLISKYPVCMKFGFAIRAFATNRNCEDFDRVTGKPHILPEMRCQHCERYNRKLKKCRAIHIDIASPYKNRYMQCPYWMSRFNNPVEFTSTQKAVINRVKKNKE